MPIEVLCNACLTPFDATLHAGLVRCSPCEARMSYRLPGTSMGRVVVL